MSYMKWIDKYDCRLRIDSVLVDKFRRLPGGINEVGIKIVRDIGLKYKYDKQQRTLDILGPDTDILGLAVETLRFWIEDDEFPDTGITCQVGYPNRGIVIWRFHGDYAKKFDHLFAEDIARLKLITSLNIKAVPTKRNPEYVELFCHFSVYHQVKREVLKISQELSKIFQDDFFIPKSDLEKAREFAVSNGKDDKILYALKEYPENKIRVWIFARNHFDVIRARKEWVTHVGIIARDNQFVETSRRSGSGAIRSASFIGHVSSAVDSERNVPFQMIGTDDAESDQNQEPHTLTNLTKSRLKSKPGPLNTSPRGPKADNSNFPRPLDFVYPVQKEEPTLPETMDDNIQSTNPYASDAFSVSVNAFETPGRPIPGEVEQFNPIAGESRWVTDGTDGPYKSRQSKLQPANRIYVHHQVNNPQEPVQLQPPTKGKNPLNHGENVGLHPIGSVGQVVHPDTNLIARERFNPTHHSKSVLTSVTDPRFAPAIRKGNKNVRPGAKAVKKPIKPVASTRKRPTLKTNQPPPAVKYNINVNGLNIYMYKQNIVKLNNMDALVNVVMSGLKQGDLVAKEMFDEMGKQVVDEIDVHLSLYGEVKTSDNIVTSAGKIPALGIIHVVSPIWQRYTVWEDCASDLHKAVYNALKTAEAHKYRKIAMPTIGSESRFGIPKDLVAEVYVKALIDYSMGMGPMYPVLEIHLVDTDPSMLKYIKDAYESWASTPGMAEDMTKHIKTDSSRHMRGPNQVSDRAQSAVSLRGMPSHRSENMVTFMEQSYTDDGEQTWTFDVLKQLTVHVYTGSIVRLKGVDAVVCAVDANMKGSLAKNVLYGGGSRYKQSLKKARGNRTLVEGDVLLCDAGDLDVSLILHSVITAPIYTASQRNLSRLDNVNTQVLYAANRQGIQRLAMPLIGSGRLRERFEVEQCALQLIDNIIEMSLSVGRGLKIKELHLVNVNHVMTQYLTQALRTRAHQQLRVETEPHAPSRTEVLTQAEAIRGTPELREKHLVQTAQSLLTGIEDEVMTGVDKTKDESTGNIDVLVQDKEQIYSSAQEGEPVDTKLYEGITDQDTNPHVQRHTKNTDVTVGSNRQTKEGRDEMEAYLSQRTLDVHNRLLRDAWLHLVDEDIEDPNSKRPSDKPERRKNNQLDPIEPGNINSLHAGNQDAKSEISATAKDARRNKRKHRIIQRSSDFELQRSKAESYKTLHERKQKYTAQAIKSEHHRIRKSQSSDDLHRHPLLSKNILNGFETERLKLLTQRERPLSGEGEELTEQEKKERELYTQKTQRYFTRGTRDRYQPGNQSEDSADQVEKINRVDVQGSNKNDISQKNDQEHASRIRQRKGKGHAIDTEREDEYMMDMDFLARERGKRKQEGDSYETTDTDNEGPLNTSYNKSDKSRQLRRERFLTLTADHKITEVDKIDTTATGNSMNGPQQNKRKLSKVGVNGPKLYGLEKREPKGKTHHDNDSNVNKVSKAKTVYANKMERYRGLETSLKPKHRKITSLSNLNRQVHGKAVLHQVPSKEMYSEYTRDPYLGYENTEKYQWKEQDPKRYVFDAVLQLPRPMNANDNGLPFGDFTMPVKPRNDQIPQTPQILQQTAEYIRSSGLPYNDAHTDTGPPYPDTENINARSDGPHTSEQGNDSEHSVNNNNFNDKDNGEQFILESKMVVKPATKSEDASPIIGPDTRNGQGTETDEAETLPTKEKEPSIVKESTENITNDDLENNDLKEENVGLRTDINDAKTIERSDTNNSLKDIDMSMPPQTPTTKQHFEIQRPEEFPGPKSGKTARTTTTRKTVHTYTLSKQSKPGENNTIIEGKKTVAFEPPMEKKKKVKPVERLERRTDMTMPIVPPRQNNQHQFIERGPNKLNKNAIEQIRQDVRRPVIAPKPEDVTIRDKIKLEIDIVKQREGTVDKVKVDGEKKKIKRFWEVVGGKDVNDEKLYGTKDSRKKDNVIVAKVTKERKMSAKSKSSKKSMMSSVHDVGGNYNLTVEVAN